MSCPEKVEIPYIQAPPPQIGFIPPTFEAPPQPYASTVIIQHANQCLKCQNGIYELQWNQQIRCNNCNAEKPKIIAVHQV
uniref:Uncharacterized protein n=1 Tax=Panagrolaimus sp. ES5 TaxID=591445 RepID=A0AC34F6D8_9BILA